MAINNLSSQYSIYDLRIYSIIIYLSLTYYLPIMSNVNELDLMLWHLDHGLPNDLEESFWTDEQNVEQNAGSDNINVDSVDSVDSAISCSPSVEVYGVNTISPSVLDQGSNDLNFVSEMPVFDQHSFLAQINLM